MNLKSRLDRLAKAATGPQAPCPHLPPVVVTEDEDGGAAPFERDAARDTRECWCGRERRRIRIVYTDQGPTGGASTGAASAEGRARIAESNRRRAEAKRAAAAA